MGALALGVLGGVAGCGQTPNPQVTAASSTITATPSPTITATEAPPPPPSSPPPGMMPRGIPMIREIEAMAVRYADALAQQLDRIEPGHTHSVTCTGVMFLNWTGAHTPCEVTTDSGAPVLWTALTQEHPTGPNDRYIEFTVGERTDVNPWPPVLPSVTPTG